MAAEVPDHRNKNEAGQHASRAEYQRTAQAHHVAQAHDEADGVEFEDHAAALGKRAHHRNKLKVDMLLPDVKCGDKKIINSCNRCSLQQQPGLRAALFARYQHLTLADQRSISKNFRTISSIAWTQAPPMYLTPVEALLAGAADRVAQLLINAGRTNKGISRRGRRASRRPTRGARRPRRPSPVLRAIIRPRMSLRARRRRMWSASRRFGEVR